MAVIVMVNMMNEYEFELAFALPDAESNPEGYLDALFEAGCEDALIFTGQHGVIGMEFTRSARSAQAAMKSAIKNVEEAIPGVELTEAKPDLVSLTEVSQVFGFSRQAARKLATNRKKRFPLPVHTGQMALWHLVEVLGWAAERHQAVAIMQPEKIIEVAVSAAEKNFEIQRRRTKINKQRVMELVQHASNGFVIKKARKIVANAHSRKN